jgi:predicted porin
MDMIGGLKKTTSRLAIAAAAGLLATQAYAADLGGNCCTDLEERIAELEATTARKGNRKVSLQVYGQVNEMVLFWDDGAMDDAYQVTNNTSRGRFGFRGSAKIDSDWSAGYRIEIGIKTAGSDAVSQFSDTSDPIDTFNPGDDLGGGTDLRHMAWYLQSNHWGTIWMGQTDTPASGAMTVNLANIPHVDMGYDDWGGSLFVRQSDGTLTTTQWKGLVNPVSSTLSTVRRNEVKYISPTFSGFAVEAAWGEDDFWGVALQYAGEFSGVRIAGKIAYTDISDPQFACTSTGGSLSSHTEVDCQMWGGSLSIMHVPTGLFVSGAYGEVHDDNRQAVWGATFDDNDSVWYIQAGLEQKFFAIGKTTLYGEYGEQQNGTLSAWVHGATMSSWGLGVVQTVDAAAMDFYLAYRQHTVEDSVLLLGAPTDDLSLLGVGAIIKF